jgi:serine/threonine protein kinase
MNAPAWSGPVFHLEPDDPREIGGYRIVARLGAGGMGRVYLATTQSGRRLALKVIRPEFADDSEFRRRFQQEITAAQRVQSLYIAPLIDADPNGAQPWLATAYVPGPSLAQVVAEHGPLPVETVRTVSAGAAEALQAVHAAGVIHRDLKPSNVLLAPDGPRIIDFGIARAADATPLTRTGVRIGSPQFMSPEQALGHASTPAIDIFALGALSYFAATGRSPFGEGPDAAVLFRIAREEPNLEGCPPPLRSLVARCLAKDPQQRPQLREIIAEFQSEAPGPSWLPPPVTQRLPAYDAAPPSPRLAAPTGRTGIGGKRIAVIGSGAVLVAVIATVIIAQTGNKNPNSAGTGGGETVSAAPTPARVNAGKSASPSPTAEPTSQTSRPETPWPGEPAGSIYQTGSVEMNTSDDGQRFDLDKNESVWVFLSGRGVDVEWREEDGVGAQNGAAFSRQEGNRAPNLSDCRGIREDRWEPFIDISRFEKPSMFCVRSDEGRYGYLHARRVTFYDSGSVRNYRFSFVLWKMPGDR